MSNTHMKKTKTNLYNVCVMVVITTMILVIFFLDVVAFFQLLGKHAFLCLTHTPLPDLIIYSFIYEWLLSSPFIHAVVEKSMMMQMKIVWTMTSIIKSLLKSRKFFKNLSMLSTNLLVFFRFCCIVYPLQCIRIKNTRLGG